LMKFAEKFLASISTGLGARTPDSSPDTSGARASLRVYRWQPHCRGLYHTPRAA
jgi:hypothetical protein